jgi:hypothetical protein
MSVLQLCSKHVVYIDHEAGITEVAQLMREEHVGCVAHPSLIRADCFRDC